MKILIDAFGGDNAPKEVVAGTVNAVNEKEGFTAVLVGMEQAIKDELKNYSYPEGRIEILNADEVITCEEEPTKAIRKPNSSIRVAFKALKENEEMNAFVSAGSTGAVLVGATLKTVFGKINGVDRPALCPVMPTFVDGKQVLLLDSGANADCKPINLCQFALMGSAFAEAMGVENPKVALLSNGTEDEKGNALNHEVFPILKNMKTINFCGNTEARDLLSGEYDVIVADGFSGNVALKSMEGALKGMLKLLKGAIYSSLSGKIGGMFLKKKITALKDKLDYSKQGGALFLGVHKPVVKAHGSSKRDSIKACIYQAIRAAENNVSDKITEKLLGEEISFQ